MVTAVVLGYLHPKSFLLSAFVLSLCLYVIHVLAIQHGIRQPFVEQDVGSALVCWFGLFGNSIGGAIGAGFKMAVPVWRTFVQSLKDF